MSTLRIAVSTFVSAFAVFRICTCGNRMLQLAAHPETFGNHLAKPLPIIVRFHLTDHAQLEILCVWPPGTSPFRRKMGEHALDTYCVLCRGGQRDRESRQLTVFNAA